MLCVYRPATGLPKARPRHGRTDIRLGALLGFFALVLQITLPALHTWQVASEYTAAWQRPVQAVSLQAQSDASALSVFDHTPSRAPHNPLLCPVCQALSQIRNYLSVPYYAGNVVVTSSSFVVTLIPYIHNVFLQAPVSRAPPSLS